LARKKAAEIFSPAANHVDDADVRQYAVSGPLVDPRAADPDQLATWRTAGPSFFAIVMSIEWSAETLLRLHDACEKFRTACDAIGVSLCDLQGVAVALSWDEEHVRARAKEILQRDAQGLPAPAESSSAEANARSNGLRIADEHGFILSSAGLHDGTRLIWFIDNRVCLSATFKKPNSLASIRAHLDNVVSEISAALKSRGT